jgi:hypothetical protein
MLVGRSETLIMASRDNGTLVEEQVARITYARVCSRMLTYAHAC